MIITEEKIRVTEQMMFDAKMSRMFITGQLAVPINGDLVWKHISELTEDDLDLIEQHFLSQIPTRN